MPFNLLFRDDVFISYSRGDGGAYAAGLADELTAKKFSCFIDKLGTEPNMELPASLKKKVRNCTLMVLVGTERGAASKFVAEEITEFKKTKRTIVPIDFGGAVGKATWYGLIPGLAAEPEENPDAQRLGDPSDNVISRIEKSFNYTRRNMRMMRLLVITTAVLLTLITASAVAAVVARNNMLKADAQTQKAAEKTRIADAAETRAAEQTKKAEDAGVRAESASAAAKKMEEQAQKAQEEARLAGERAAAAKAEAARAQAEARKAQAEAAESQAKATTAEKTARDATTEAKRQEALALANAKAAKEQQKIAEERTTYVRAQQMAVQADIDIDRGDDLERSILLSVESLKKAWTPDGYAAWAKGMALLPHTDEVKFADREENVSAVAYSPDGRFFAQGTKDGGVTFFRTDGTAEPVRKQLSGGVGTIVFGENWVAAVGGGGFVMWDSEGFKELRSSRTLEGLHGQPIAFSPDGRYVAAGGPASNEPLRVFDTVSSRTVINTRLEHVGYVMSFAFSPDGRWLAVACVYKKYEEKKDEESPRAQGNAVEIVSTRDEAAVGRILFWDVSGFGKGAASPPAPAGWFDQDVTVHRIAFGPKGRHLVTEDGRGVVRLWQVVDDDDGRISLRRTEAKGEMTGGGINFQNYGKVALVFSPDESYMATVPDKGAVRLWDVGSGREVSRIMDDKEVKSIAFSPDGHFATVGGGGVKFWKTEFGSEDKRLVSANETNGDGARDIAVSPGGEWLVTAGDDGARLFSTADWSQVKKLDVDGRVSKLTFSADGRWLVAAGEGTATVFETKRWEARKEIPPPETESRGAPLVGFSPDGKLLVAASYGLVRLFGGDPWREIRALRQDNAVKKMAFSPDGQWLAVFVKGDNHGEHVIKPNEVHIWNTSDWTSAACKDDEPRPADDTQQSRYSVCADVKGAEREVALSEVLRWKETPGPDPLKDTRGPGGEDYVSPDGLWSVVNRGLALQLFYAEGGGRPVATLMRGALTFTPDSRWLLVYEGGNVGLWPLERARMIDAACARLHRRDLTEEERRQYISDGGTEATCAPAR